MESSTSLIRARAIELIYEAEDAARRDVIETVGREMRSQPSNLMRELGLGVVETVRWMLDHDKLPGFLWKSTLTVSLLLVVMIALAFSAGSTVFATSLLVCLGMATVFGALVKNLIHSTSN
ncbi:MAG: hypothetical protein GY838_09980 [bacterium]|nr:hypothetical protein [bacterium]